MRRFVTVDVFTARPFGGNPLAVVPEAKGLSTESMQRISREFNYSETSFVLPPDDPAHHARVRIFTPGQELPFAGHPNVGTAFVLALRRLQRGETVPERFLFEELAGLVPVRPLWRDEAMVGAELTAPTPFHAGRSLDSEAVARAIGLPAALVSTAAHAPMIGSAGLPFVLVELADKAAVDRAAVDQEGFAGLAGPDGDAVGVYLYARAGQGIHARMLSPLDGIGEDPATGSAAAALGGLLGVLDGPLTLEIAQGVAMGRPSLLRVTVTEAGEIRVGGECVPMTSGEFAFG